MNTKNYLKSIKRANRLSKMYYSGNESVPDSEFDALIESIKEYEKTHTPSKDSPTQKVGSDLTKGFSKFVHEVPMLSLSKALSIDEMKTWLLGIKKSLKSKKLQFTIDNKMDGCSLSLHYKKGSLIRAVTRGNGIQGDVVTNNAKVINGIPHTISYKKPIEIRGEVIFPRSEFNKAIKRGETLKNCRNTASGAIRLHDPSEVKKRNLKFYAYTVISGEATQYRDVQFLKDNKFNTVMLCLTSDIDKILSICDKMEEGRDKLDYDIDGLVIKINSKSEQKKLGSSHTNPKFAIAYKFPNKVVYPKLKKVIFQVGRTGAITPVAVFNPVMLCGTSVNKASIHNYRIVKELGIKIGDTISVIKSGEIIPQVKGVFKKGEERKSIVFPNKCPVCSSSTKFIGEKLFCTNSKCEAKVIGNISNWCHKSNMNIDGVSYATIKTLYDNNLVSNVVDLYKLTKKKLVSLDGIQSKSAKNIINSIEESKKAGLSRVISGLGIDTIGNTISEELAGKYRSLESLSKASKKSLMKIDTVADKKANNIIKFFKNNKKLINGLYKIEGMILNEVSVKTESSKLKNKTFCITGTLSKPRDKMQQVIKSNGGKVSSSITSKIDYLISGIGGGSKLTKAESLGIKIISENEFNKLLKRI